MATTQLESGSFMVGMNHDCKSASMNWAGGTVAPAQCVKSPSLPPAPERKESIQAPHPLTFDLTFELLLYFIFSFVAVFAPSTLISSRRTCNRRLSHSPAIPNSLAVSLVSGLHLAREGMIQG